MFDIIRKSEFFEWWTSGVIDRNRFDLKAFQDAWITTELAGITGKHILEIGGRSPRLLLRLAEKNTCVNADAVLPDTNQPEQIRLQSVDTMLGQFDPRLEDDSFDLAFSISVMEHVPTEELDDCFKDTARVLKPGGRLLHAIDVYLGSDPAKNTAQRLEAYRTAAEKAGLELECPRTLCSDPAFTADMVSNSDYAMASWNEIAPSLIEVRKVCQCVSVKAVWNKPE